MVFDLIFFLVISVMVGLGAWRGAVISGAGLFGLVAGYAGAVLAAIHLGDWVATTLVVSPLVAPAVAGTLGFVLAWLVFSCAADVAVAWDQRRVADTGRGFIDRALGGFFGFARGGLIVVLLALLASWLDAGRDLGVIEGLAGMPYVDHSIVARASGDMVEAGVASALADAGPAGEVAARITGHPKVALENVQTLLADERLARLFEDKLFWTLVTNRSIDYAMNRGAILAIVNDAEMRGRFVDLGMVGPEAREDSGAFRQEMATVLEQIAPRINRLHVDPAIKELAEDPEIMQLVAAGDTFALIRHPRIKQLVDRLSKDL